MTEASQTHSAPAVPRAPGPRVSVLLAVHDGLPFLEAALRSIMSQTLGDIEILVVDDASTDGTPAVLARLAAEDGRVRVARLDENLRLPGALNHGLGLVRAPLVARMDADDVAHPERLAVQARYLDAHPGVVAVGASLRRIRADGAAFQTSVRPRDAFMCRWIFRFRLPVVHPTIMFRYPLPDGSRPLYDPHFPVTEDHDFFVRMLPLGGIVCLPDVLLDYRHHDANVTRTRWERQNADAERICRRFMASELPADVAAALEPAIAAFFRFSPEPAGAVLDGFRRMLRHDALAHPAYRAWLRRQTAQLAFDTLVRSGRGRREAALAFLGPGRDLLPFLALRLAEVGRVLPARLTTYADVWAAPGTGPQSP